MDYTLLRWATFQRMGRFTCFSRLPVNEDGSAFEKLASVSISS